MSRRRDNIVLTGMPGTGKTTVGRVVAGHLGWPLVDLDARIAQAAGMSVDRIFATGGEPAFRARERAAVAALAGTRQTVIATGGWTAADPDNRAALESLGPVVCLTAEPAALAARLAAEGSAGRPLLGDGLDAGAVAALARRRRPVYDSLPLQVDTTGRDPEAVAHQVRALVAAAGQLELRALPVTTPAGGYSVLVGTGATDALGALMAARGLAGPVAVVTDPTVDALYGQRAERGLVAAGLPAARQRMGEGEAAKSLATVAELYEAFVAAGLDRAGTVVALGGGVVGDTAGFAAATYLRGVPLVQAPTTLLAMVDAAIGGKTGINLPAGKNLAGAFHHPVLVAADPALLATLPEEIRRAGLAEVVKAALIADVDLLEWLERTGPPAPGDAREWATVVAAAAAVKTAVVSEDPHEHGRRAVLNLGHTFAHALERETGYRMAHGDAVAVGLVAAARLADRLGLAEAGLAERVERLLLALGLPVRYDGPAPATLVAAMAVDKKRRAGRLRFVLPRGPGAAEIADDVPEGDVLATLQGLRASPPTVDPPCPAA